MLHLMQKTQTKPAFGSGKKLGIWRIKILATPSQDTLVSKEKTHLMYFEASIKILLFFKHFLYYM